MSIFTTGAHIEPRQLANGRWAWVVTAFDGDSFNDGPIFDTPRGYLSQDDYHAPAEHWGKELGIEPYKPCVAVYRFENGRLVITIQGDPNKATEVVAEALEQDGFGEIRGRSPVMKIRAVRDLEQTMLFTLDMVDLPLGEVYDSAGREFKTAPLCRDAINAALDRDVERRRATVNVSPEVLKQWPEWAAAIALRIADESPYVEDKALLITVLKDCFLAAPHVAHRLIGTGIIESGYLNEPI